MVMKLKLSISQKLMLLVVFTGIFVALSISVILIARQYSLATGRAKEYLRSQAAILALDATAPLAFGDRVTAGQTLAALGALPQIKLARIYDDKKQLFAYFVNGRVEGQAFLNADPFFPAEQRVGDYIVLSGKPIIGSNSSTAPLGILELVYDMRSITRRAYTDAALSGFIAVVTTLVSLLGALRLSNIIANPLGELNRTASKISETKDYSVRASRFSDDELGQLTDVMNEMLSEVETAARERERLLESERIARANAEQSSQLKDEFLATLSHELRSPLSAIIGWVYVLRQTSQWQGQATDDLAKGLEVIERNARVQAKLVEDLLDMSRIVSGKFRLDAKEVDLAAVIAETLETVWVSAEAKEIHLQRTTGPLVGLIYGDPARLQQVVWNLLSNAIKFTPRGGRVQVVLQRINSYVELSVSDNGQGIAPEFLPYIFERFRQADASTTREHGGLGLGLAIVKHIVEMHGGTVMAASAGPGKGAAFTVRLPPASLHQRPHDDRAQPGTPFTRENVDVNHVVPGACDGVPVLLVEDDPDARDLVRRLLEEAGAMVRCAQSSAEGLGIFTEFHPAVLISDIGMPGKDGYQFIREVRRLPPEKGGLVPAIALTAFARLEDRARALVAGYHMHIVKPVNPEELLAGVAKLADLSRSMSHGRWNTAAKSQI